MSPTALRERLEALQQDVRTGDRHDDVVTRPLGEAVRGARVAEEQALCTHPLPPVEHIMGSWVKKFCPVCRKDFPGEDVR